MKITTAFLGLIVFMSTANASETALFKVNGQYAQVPYTYNAGSWASGAVSVDGTGISQTAFLYYSAYSSSTGYQFWRGAIPIEAVKVTGVASMSVDIDTCTVSATSGCGYVKFTVATNEPASGWVNNGVWGYSYGDYVVRYAGASQVRSASATGTILGQAVDNPRGWIGTMDDVTVEVQVGN